MRWSRVPMISIVLAAGAGLMRALPPANGPCDGDYRFRLALARVLEQAGESTRRESETVADAKIQLLGFYRRHPRMIVRDESAYFPINFAALCHFARQSKNVPLPELLAALAQLIPGTGISPIRHRQQARAKALEREIYALKNFRARLTVDRRLTGHIQDPQVVNKQCRLVPAK